MFFYLIIVIYKHEMRNYNSLQQVSKLILSSNIVMTVIVANTKVESVYVLR